MAGHSDKMVTATSVTKYLWDETKIVELVNHHVHD